jgi:nucleoside-diphosphate-sugar epimerase
VQTAFVLGGTGQIGRAVAQWLGAAGWHVTVGARHEPDPPVDARFVRVDRTVPGALETAIGGGVDVLVDVVPLRAADGEQLRGLAGRVGSVVAISTGGVYEDDAGRPFGDPEAAFPVPITEGHATVAPGGDDYHSTKRTIELALLEDEPLRATIIRPCAIHGPHGRQLREWFFVQRALDGRRVVVLAQRGEGRFHTTSVDNLAELVRLAAEQPGSRALNCGDPDPPNVLEISRAIAAAMDVEWTEVLLPGAEQGTVGDHPWNTPRPFVVDMTRAATELGYQPVKTYAQAVERTVAWLVDARPPAASYMQPMFDYPAEDAFLRDLS